MTTSAHKPVTLLAAQTTILTSTGEDAVEISLPGAAPLTAVQFVLDVTAAATAAADTLDVFVQTQLDETNWVDVVHFTQVVGDGGALRYISKVTADLANAEFEVGTALGAAAARNLLGHRWRARWVLVDDGTDNASFTFSIVAVPQ